MNEVKKNGCLVFITHHGKPRYAILPTVDIPEEAVLSHVIGIKELAKNYSKVLKTIENSEMLCITSHQKPFAQLISIEPDDVDDIIVSYSRDLQAEAEKYATLESPARLKSASSLLDELKTLRDKAGS